jgi:hypothetical protein
MNEFVVAWVLVTAANATGYPLAFSPHLATLESCENLKRNVRDFRNSLGLGMTTPLNAVCIEVKVRK